MLFCNLFLYPGDFFLIKTKQETNPNNWNSKCTVNVNEHVCPPVCLCFSLTHTHTLQLLWLSLNKVASSSGKKWAGFCSVWLLPSICDNTNPVCLWASVGVHHHMIVCLCACTYSFIYLSSQACVHVCLCVCVCNEAWRPASNRECSKCSLFYFKSRQAVRSCCHCVWSS